MIAANVLVVDDEPDICSLVQEILVDEGLLVQVAHNGEEARAIKQSIEPDLILLDIWMPDIDGISLLKEWKEHNQLNSPVVMMSGHGTVETAVEATRLGAYDFIEKPLSLAKLLLTVKHALEKTSLQQENKRLLQFSQSTDEPIGKSELMQNLRSQIQRISNHNTPVLISGEPGTDKEIFARYIHANSQRADKPMLTVGLSTLSGEASITEIFGSEKDGIIQPGLLEKAESGTLFLKDVADMHPSLQALLQSALDSGKITRNNGSIELSIDVRIIAASREDLEPLVKIGQFRDDLFYQLSVVPIVIPPLREHAADIPELLEFYVNVFVERESLPYRKFSVAAQNRLRQYHWPGNTRELKNFVQRLLILGTDESIELEEVNSILGPMDDNEQKSFDTPSQDFDLPIREARENFEKRYFEYQLDKAEGSVSKVAGIVGMERTHLYRKLKALKIDIKG